MTILPFLEDSVFGPRDIQAMSTALEDVCKTLNLADEAKSEGDPCEEISSPLCARASAMPRSCVIAR